VELAGSGYLYTLAVVATTFAGFAVITMIFHQVYGGHVTKLDSFVARTFTQVGFLATLGALLPPLVAQFELTPATVWRAASAGLAALLGLWSLSFPHRRHKAATTPIPPLVWSVVVVLDLTAILLLGNALLSLPAHAAGHLFRRDDRHSGRRRQFLPAFIDISVRTAPRHRSAAAKSQVGLRDYPCFASGESRCYRHARQPTASCCPRREQSI